MKTFVSAQYYEGCFFVFVSRGTGVFLFCFWHKSTAPFFLIHEIVSWRVTYFFLSSRPCVSFPLSYFSCGKRRGIFVQQDKIRSRLENQTEAVNEKLINFHIRPNIFYVVIEGHELEIYMIDNTVENWGLGANMDDHWSSIFFFFFHKKTMQ